MTRANVSRVPKRRGKKTRAAYGSLTREQVIEASNQVIREHGVEGMTIRGLAAELGVAPMSIYRYFEGKDEILNEVVDRRLGEVWRPEADPSDWQAWLFEACERFRAFLVSQPGALHAYFQHPMTTPVAKERLEAFCEVLEPVFGDNAPEVYATTHTYVLGFAALQASRQGWRPDEGDELAERLAAMASSSQFEDGLRYLLAGIQQAL